MVINQYREQRGKSISEDMRKRGGWSTQDRPFVAWDGEGYSLPDGSHHFMLWGSSEGDMISGESLGTVECFDLMLTAEMRNPDVFHVIFSGSYDVNMMLRDVPREKLRRLKVTNQCEWSGYRLEYIRSKWLRVTRRGVTVTLYDVFTFFATSFVKALQEYIGETDEDVVRIVAGKAQRDNFTYTEIDQVERYWRSELRYLVRLCERLRNYLSTAGIRISRWHGPGAISSAVLRQQHFTRVTCESDVNVAAQFAFSGGRFEAFKIGLYDGPVWQYDIRSAYPSVIATLPTLGAEWTHSTTVGGDIRSFSLYRIELHSVRRQPKPVVGPFAWRDRNGAVYYPSENGGTWVWGVELIAALGTPWADLIEIHEAWLYEDDGRRPFSFITEMYERRAQWKAEGNPAQLALKLAMNSIYGKLAQQVGCKYDPLSGWKLPAFHQLEYAGYILAATRATILTAINLSPSTVIAAETDAVFSTTPLTLSTGNGLGEWEAKEYTGICYLQSGLYFAKDDKGEWKPRTRGFTRNKLDPSQVFEYLRKTKGYDSGTTPLIVNERRFRTIGTSIGRSDWRRWIDEERHVSIGMPGGKREHWSPSCGACENGLHAYGDALHDTVPALSATFDSRIKLDYRRESTRYPLRWKGDPPAEYKDAIEWMREDEDVEWELA
jgi:DNA polymerase elongation subunit (family B)